MLIASMLTPLLHDWIKRITANINKLPTLKKRSHTASKKLSDGFVVLCFQTLLNIVSVQTKLFSLKAPNYIWGGREIANVLNYLNKIEITVPLKILHSSKLLAKGRGHFCPC